MKYNKQKAINKYLNLKNRNNMETLADQHMKIHLNMEQETPTIQYFKTVSIYDNEINSVAKRIVKTSKCYIVRPTATMDCNFNEQDFEDQTYVIATREEYDAMCKIYANNFNQFNTL